MAVQEIIESFGQGKTGNCVSIACIKAGIAKWGEDQVFQNFKGSLANGADVIMRDGFSTIIRPHDFTQAKKMSKFVKLQNADMYNWAEIYFAAMAKRVLVESGFDARGLFLNKFKRAIKSLNNGDDYMEGIHWIGFNKSCRKKNTLADIDYNNPVVAASPKHCFFIYQGFYDRYGTATPITKLETERSVAFRAVKYFVEIV